MKPENIAGTQDLSVVLSNAASKSMLPFFKALPNVYAGKPEICRRLLSVLVWMRKEGATWCGLLEVYGCWHTIYQRLCSLRQEQPMIRCFEKWVKLLVLWSVFLPFHFTANADPSGEIIFVHPTDPREIWISDVNGHNARKLFKPPLIILEISIQEGDQYILVVGEGVFPKEGGIDAYLFDRRNPAAGRKDLTWGRFGEVCDAVISRNGNVVFTNSINGHPDGLYLIPNHEVSKLIPKAKKIFHGPACHVDWSPNGEDIAFSNEEGVFLLNIFTKQTSLLVKSGFYPVFSPDGKQLAFSLTTPIQNGKQQTGIAIAPPRLPADVEIVALDEDHSFLRPTWSADGKYIAYLTFFGIRGLNQRKDNNFAIPATGGNPVPILKLFEKHVWTLEWTNVTYPVEVTHSLVTTWAELKVPKGIEKIQHE